MSDKTDRKALKRVYVVVECRGETVDEALVKTRRVRRLLHDNIEGSTDMIFRPDVMRVGLWARYDKYWLQTSYAAIDAVMTQLYQYTQAWRASPEGKFALESRNMLPGPLRHQDLKGPVQRWREAHPGQSIFDPEARRNN